MEEKYTIEIYRELKTTAKKWFLSFVVACILLVVSNTIWACAWAHSQKAVLAYDIETESAQK